MAEHNNLYQRAVYYDIALERDVSQETDFILASYRHYTGGELGSVLDLACGPGYHARDIARRGLHATGLDLRPEMLELAREKAAAEEINLTCIEADMRDFRLENPVEMAICMFDSLDALLKNEDIFQHFQAVAENLTEGGLYLVDLSHPRTVGFDHYSNFRYCGERDGVRVEIVWATNHPRFDLVTGIAHTEIEIQIVDQGVTFMLHDSADERLFYPQELHLLAELSGAFRVAGWHGNYSLDQPLDYSPGSQRMIAIFQKK